MKRIPDLRAIVCDATNFQYEISICRFCEPVLMSGENSQFKFNK